ncbi:MAG: hypothetical protein KDK62_06250 [Chlamydiia bacterium]|nr:hypothetical protein [Chlamydiia bacterium]
MRHVKSERLKKLEVELNDLEQWLKLGLVPKKDIDKHKDEIEGIKAKIEEEKERLQFLKESGDMDEYVAPKRSQQSRGGFTDMPTIPDIDMSESQTQINTESGFDMDSESDDNGTSDDDDKTEDDNDDTESDDESYFSDKNRWKRGGIIDPDADDW